MARGRDGVEVKSMINVMLVKKDMLRFVQDVRAVREKGRDLSDHHIVQRKVRLVGHGLRGEKYWL